jgi:hypothetical protein
VLFAEGKLSNNIAKVGYKHDNKKGVNTIPLYTDSLIKNKTTYEHFTNNIAVSSSEIDQNPAVTNNSMATKIC